MDTHFRSVVKGISWRILATCVTMTVVFLYSGEWAAAAFVGLMDALVKVVLYWGHERLWQRLTWGRILPTVSSP